MVDSLSSDDWERIENRVLTHIPLGSVKSQEEFKQKIVDKFLQSKGDGELTRGQMKFADKIWNDLADNYEEFFEEEEKERKRVPSGYIEVSLKEYPREAKRFFKSMNIYQGILKYFQKGYNRADITDYYQKQTNRKRSTINRDIASFIKIGILKKRKSKMGRGYYNVESNVYV
jgi:hypothetical protein